MLNPPRTLIFDTSGLNGLLKDPNHPATMAGIRLCARVKITETNLAEIGATEDEEKRGKLVRLCQSLLSVAECIQPYHGIIEALVKMHSARQGAFNWNDIPVRAVELEAEVARPEYLTRGDIAAEIREDFRDTEQQFKQLWRDAREKFPIAPQDRIVTTLADVIEVSEASDAHWNFAADIYEHHSGARLPEQEMRVFTRECPPFKMLMLGACLAQFHHAVRDHRLTSRYKTVGRLDLLSAVYLPYAERFVTDDAWQYNALRDLAEIGGLQTKVLTYEEFRDSWTISAN